MKSWRERIAEARERGHFTPEDHRDAGNWNRCLVGEVALKFGWVHDQGNFKDRRLEPLVEVCLPGKTDYNDAASLAICDAVGANDFDMAEKLLNLIEDTALDLKRKL